MRQLIEYNYIYIAQPPLYKLQRNKEIYYAYNDKQKDQIMEQTERDKLVQLLSEYIDEMDMATVN
jgi:DNA gyrase subunit B